MEVSISQDTAEKLQRASLAKTEQLIQQGCVLCRAEMFTAELSGGFTRHGILVRSDNWPECDGNVMSSPVSVPVCYACADRLGIKYKKGA